MCISLRGRYANSWHVSHYTSDNQRCVDFNGTNDNHPILPLYIKQYLPWDTDNEVWSHLLSKNGRMFDVIIEKSLACVELEKGKSNVTLLQYTKSASKDPVIRIDALIDSGALLVGQSNTEVAQFIMKECLYQKDTKLKGVTYFDEDKKSWTILEVSGRWVYEKGSVTIDGTRYICSL